MEDSSSTAVTLWFSPVAGESGVFPSQLQEVLLGPALAARVGVCNFDICEIVLDSGSAVEIPNCRPAIVVRALIDSSMHGDDAVLHPAFEHYFHARTRFGTLRRISDTCGREKQIAGDAAVSRPIPESQVARELVLHPADEFSDFGHLQRSALGLAASRQLQGFPAMPGRLYGVHFLGQPRVLLLKLSHISAAGSLLWVARSTSVTIASIAPGRTIQTSDKKIIDVASTTSADSSLLSKTPPGLGDSCAQLLRAIQVGLGEVVRSNKNVGDGNSRLGTRQSNFSSGVPVGSVGQHVLLEGAPGSGRSTIVRWCVKQLLQHLKFDTDVSVHSFDPPSLTFPELGTQKGSALAAQSSPVRVYFLDDADRVLCLPQAQHVLARLDEALASPRTVVVAVSQMLQENSSTTSSLDVSAAHSIRQTAAKHLQRRFSRILQHFFVTVDQRCEVIVDMVQRECAATQTPSSWTGFDALGLSRATAGFDLHRLCEVIHTLSALSWDQVSSGFVQNLVREVADFHGAVRSVPVMEPGQVGNGTTAPGLPLKPAFEDIGGYTSVKAALNRLIVSQFSDRASAVRLGVQPTSGVLLSGPTGCGKTLFARQIATAVAAFGVSFLAIKPTEVFSKYLGDSEKTLRAVFRRAREESPSVLFIDEIDALVVARNLAGGGGGGFSGLNERMLTTLLSEMDGVDKNEQVIFLAATNNISSLDKALLRPGRIDSILTVGAPSQQECCEILAVHSKQLPIETASDHAESIDFELYAARAVAAGATGADLQRVCQEAALMALREDVENATTIARRHFDAAFSTVLGSGADQ